MRITSEKLAELLKDKRALAARNPHLSALSERKPHANPAGPVQNNRCVPGAVRKQQASGAGWREVGGHRIYFRSRWEANYARFLEWEKERGLIAHWEYETQTFWFEEIKRGVRSYTPDFSVLTLDSMVTYIEVKGWMDPKSKTKLKRMAKYYPDVKLHVVDARWFREFRHLVGIVPGWETETK